MNSLALCYSDGVSDSGGGQPQQQQSTQREYRHASPYRSYPASHPASVPARHLAYPYSGDVDSKCHDDLYVNERSAPQRASSRTTSASPPTDTSTSMSTTAGPTDYSSAAIYRASHMSPTTEVPARRTTASPPPPSQASTPPPKQTTQTTESRSPSPVTATQESPTTQQPTSTPIPTQIFPWMRRMHLGHGKLLYAIALVLLDAWL